MVGDLRSVLEMDGDLVAAAFLALGGLALVGVIVLECAEQVRAKACAAWFELRETVLFQQPGEETMGLIAGRFFGVSLVLEKADDGSVVALAEIAECGTGGGVIALSSNDGGPLGGEESVRRLHGETGYGGSAAASR